MSDVSTGPVQNPRATLRSLLGGHYQFQFLSTGLQLGLFRLLHREPGLSRAEIGSRVGLEELPARVLLLGCVAIGLLRKDGDRYFTTPMSEPLAGELEDVPAAFGPWRHYRPMAWFAESLKENTNIGLQREVPGDSPDLYGRLAGNPELEQAFQKLMGAASREVAAELVQKVDLSGYSHILDIGGGTATNAAAIANQWPELRITILDLPTVVAKANARIAELGLADRVQAVGLDAFNDELPTDADCVFFGHFLEIWSVEKIKALLAKAARAVGPGGGLVVVAPTQHDDETGPPIAAALSAYFHAVASGEGMTYTCAEYEKWFTEAGFRPTGRIYVGSLNEAVISGVRIAAV